MKKLALIALLAALPLVACNGVTMSGPSANAGGAGYSGQSMEAGGPVGDVGLGSGGFAASGLAGGSIGGAHAAR